MKLQRPKYEIFVLRFLDAVNADMKKGSLIVTKKYYTDIVKLLTQPRYIHDVPNEIVPNFLRCASKLLAYQIVKRMMSTMRHFLEVFDDEMRNPLLVVQIAYHK